MIQSLPPNMGTHKVTQERGEWRVRGRQDLFSNCSRFVDQNLMFSVAVCSSIRHFRTNFEVNRLLVLRDVMS